MCLRPTRSINYTSQIAVLFIGIYAAINLFIISRCGEKSAESMSNEKIDLFHAKILIFGNLILTCFTAGFVFVLFIKFGHCIIISPGQPDQSSDFDLHFISQI
jgi:hypothetical protein